MGNSGVRKSNEIYDTAGFTSIRANPIQLVLKNEGTRGVINSWPYREILASVPGAPLSYPSMRQFQSAARFKFANIEIRLV